MHCAGAYTHLWCEELSAEAGVKSWGGGGGGGWVVLKKK